MTPVKSTIPTLARLSFWIPPEQMDEFGAAYDDRIAPLLQRHELVESPQRSRSVAEGVFCRLFAVESPAEVTEKQTEFERDPAWQGIISICCFSNF